MYNICVYSPIFKYAWTILAPIALLVFVGVMVLHPYMPHHHDHAVADAQSLGFIHTGIVERGVAILVLVPIIFFLSTIQYFLQRFSRALVQRGLQDVDIPWRLPFASAFSKGLLHSKVH